MVRSRWRLAAYGLAVVVGVGVLSVPQVALAASSAQPVAEPRIAAVMAEVPGGILVDANHAVWPDLDMEMETPVEGAFAPFSVGQCATGYVCAFDTANAAGAKLSWGSCATQSVTSFTVRSIANARSGGYAQARSGTVVRATANAGGYANVYASVDNVRCVA